MARTCKGICLRIANQHIFSKKALQYDEGSYCATCSIWISKPTNSKLDIILVCMPNLYDRNYQYYDKDGNRKNVTLLHPIPVLVKPVRCECCKTQARGKSHKNSALRSKIFNTFKKSDDRKTLKELGLKRAPRGVSKKSRHKKELAKRSKEIGIDSDYDYQESVFDTEGIEFDE